MSSQKSVLCKGKCELTGGRTGGTVTSHGSSSRTRPSCLTTRSFPNVAGSERAQRTFVAGDQKGDEPAIDFAVLLESYRRFFAYLHQVLHGLREDGKRLLGAPLIGPEGVLRDHCIVAGTERPRIDRCACRLDARDQDRRRERLLHRLRQLCPFVFPRAA